MAPRDAPNSRLGPTSTALIALLLVVAGAWVGHQGGIRPVQPVLFLTTAYDLVAVLPFVAALWLGAAGLGWAMRMIFVPAARGALVIQVGAGLAALLLGFWGLGVLGWLNAMTAWGLCIAGAALLIHQALRPRYRDFWVSQRVPRLPWPVLLACPIVGVMLVASMCPPGTLWRIEAFGYDVLSYHLQLPREWLAAGRIQGLHHNVYSYLPNLVEAGYMAIGAMCGSMRDGIYVAQVFHVSAAVVAAAALGGWVSRAGAGDERMTPAGRTTAAAFAGVALLVLPWTMVTGTLAYDEMYALAMGVAAMVVAFDPTVRRTFRGAALAGVLAGALTLAKLPFGPMIALPVGLIYVLGLNAARPGAQTGSVGTAGAGPSQLALWRRHLALGAIAGLAGLLTIAPYLVRNRVWTGNPVFPFAAARLGSGHWGPQEVERWNRGHGLSSGAEDEHRLFNLGRHWLFNTGYGALGSVAKPELPAGDAHRNIAHFQQEWGFPMFWLVAAGGGIIALMCRGVRRPALAMVLTLALQLTFWLTATHLQSRFLIPTLLPGCGMIGLGLAVLLRRRGSQGARARLPRAPLVVAALFVLALAGSSYLVFLQQTVPNSLTRRPAEPWQVCDILLPPATLDHLKITDQIYGNMPIDHLPAYSKTLLVADNTRLLLIRRPIVYESAFDHSELGDMIRAAHGDPARVTAALRGRGITHVWVHWDELRRLHETYGFDADVTQETLLRLARAGGWRRILGEEPWYTLYELP